MARGLLLVGIFILIAAALLWRISAGADVHVVLVGCLTFCLLT